MNRRRDRRSNLDLEYALHDDWKGDLKMVEVPLGNRSLAVLGAIVFAAGALIAGRIIFLSIPRGDYYEARAESNSSQVETTLAPRGAIHDRQGNVIAEDEPVFVALLDVDQFFRHPELEAETLVAVNKILGVPEEEVFKLLEGQGKEGIGGKLLIKTYVSQSELVQVRGANLPTLEVSAGFGRRYSNGRIFSSVVGYTGLADQDDLKRFPELTGQDLVGKDGVESYYDEELRGKPGTVLARRNAKGEILEKKEVSKSTIGSSLDLTIDGDLQKYFYGRMQEGLWSLGRTTGVGIALDPRNGEILALVDFPSFDNNVFTSSGSNEDKRSILSDPDKPLFNRAISGLYSPGSTIKPLVATAALSEGVIDPNLEIFSPGYLDVPNPYDPEKPTRYLDWRHQGYTNLEHAIAQSSNVYFYTVGGGFGDIKGLGITRLHNWWEKFRLGDKTGIDIPGEASGYLPTPADKEKRTKLPWLLGDTFNVSIGQGDLLVTPIELLSYISAVGNGGHIYKPFVVRNGSSSKVLADLSELRSQFGEVIKGMIGTTRLPLGTAYSLHELPFTVAAKTGTAQVRNNEQENAFFVGLAPVSSPGAKKVSAPQIAVLVLIEHSKEGSVNTIPIAKDVLEWYYYNRIVK